MSHRMLQVNENLQRELSRIMAEQFDWEGALVTLTQVIVLPDLRTATAFVSVLNSKEPGKRIDLLNKRSYDLYEPLSQRLRMKFVPKIEFRLDEQPDEIGRIDQLLDQI